MTVTTLDVSALLQAHVDRSQLDAASAAALVADTLEVPDAVVLQWLAGAVPTNTETLRNLIIKLGIDRETAKASIEPLMLASAVWSASSGAALAKARKKARLSLEGLAAAANISTATVRRWEKGTHSPRPARLAPALKAVKLTAGSLLETGGWPPAELPSGDRTAFSLWIMRVREQFSLSQAGLASKLGTTQAVISSWSRGASYPEAATWPRLAASFTDMGAPITATQLLLLQPPESAPVGGSSSVLSRRLTDARISQRLSYAAVAHLSGVTAAQVTAFSTGKARPSADVAARLARVLELDVAEINSLVDEENIVALEARTSAILCSKFSHRPDRGAWMGARVKALGERQADVADLIGVHRNTMSFWTTGRLPVPEDMTEKIASVFSVDPAFIASLPAQPYTPSQSPAKQLRARRAALSLSQREVGAMVGLGQSGVSALELGRAKFTPRLSALLNEMLQTSIAA